MTTVTQRIFGMPQPNRNGFILEIILHDKTGHKHNLSAWLSYIFNPVKSFDKNPYSIYLVFSKFPSCGPYLTFMPQSFETPAPSLFEP